MTEYDYRRRRISLYHPILYPLLLPTTTFRGLRQVHALLAVTGLLRDPFAASRTIKFAAVNFPSYAVKLLSHLPNPDAFSFNTLLQRSHKSNAFSQFSYFQTSFSQSFKPNSHTFTILAAAAAGSGSVNPVAAKIVHAQTLNRGLMNKETLPVYNSLIHSYVSCGLIDSARQLFDEMCHRDLVTWNSMISGYIDLGDLKAAQKLFSEVHEKNVVTWNIMIGGHLQWRCPEIALRFLQDMFGFNVSGNEKTMVIAVTACGRLGRKREGMSVHGSFIRRFEAFNLIFETALVDMYSKCKRVDIAKSVFDRMRERNTITWNAMVLGHCIHGSSEEGLALFQEMVEIGKRIGGSGAAFGNEKILPDEVTFVGVLCACARAGLLDEGNKYFDEMKNVYEITPAFAHYWCMANLYGSLKLFHEAENVLKSMPGDAQSLFWSSLLGSSRFSKNVELGENIAKRLIDLEPYNGSHYALLWNIYAVADRWEDVQRLKELMVARGLEIFPGHSLLDLNTLVHNFKVGDRLQERMEELCLIMDDFTACQRSSHCRADSWDDCQMKDS